MLTRGDSMNFSYEAYKDKGYKFFNPLLELCLNYEGSGDIDDDDTTYVAVVIPSNTEKKAIIVTTKRAHDRKSMEIQNIESLLFSKHSILDINIVYSQPKDIHAILHDAKSKGKSDSKEVDEARSAALQDLENIVTEAVVTGTSDIHFYVYEDRAEAVFRIGGVFSRRTPLGREQAISIIAAGLNTKSPDYRSVTDDNEMTDVSIYLTIDIPESNSAEKGSSTSLKSKREKINLRTSKSGSLEGPHTVMRVIRTSQEAKITMQGLGMDGDIRDMLVKATDSPSGIILLTGPTGSGKSTTLAALYEIIEESRKIMLLEDPVEYKVRRKNTVQKPVYPSIPGLGFLDYLKNALRQDPDIIGISEMRSKEVADIVVKSALTGHLMVSTLHTNDAIGAIVRLIDEGVSPKILSERDLFRAVAAQRLIPALCPNCRVKGNVTGFSGAFVKSKNGCDHCEGTGLKGRVLVAELIVFDDECRGFIANHNLAGLEKYIRSNGWKSMADRARMRINEGVIDPFEAKRYITNLFGEESKVTYPDVSFEYVGITPA